MNRTSTTYYIPRYLPLTLGNVVGEQCQLICSIEGI